jgi:hypothetical protein
MIPFFRFMHYVSSIITVQEIPFLAPRESSSIINGVKVLAAFAYDYYSFASAEYGKKLGL